MNTLIAIDLERHLRVRIELFILVRRGFFKYFKDRFAYLYVYTSSLTGNSYFSFYMDFEPISTFLYQHKFQTNDKYIHKSC